MLTAPPFDGDTILPLADARVHLNLTSDDSFHDAAVEELRDAAIGWVEGYTGLSLQSRNFTWATDRFTSRMRLPMGPVTAIVGVSYYGSAGTDTVLASWYFGNGMLTAAQGSTWPYASGQPGGIRITFTAGFANAAAIPPFLLAAVKLAMSAMFEDRSNPDFSGAMRCADQFRQILV